MNKVFVVTNLAPLYREALWIKLLNSEKYSFHFVYGRNEEIGIKEIDFNSIKFRGKRDQIHLTKNIHYKGKYLIWQKGIISKCLTYNFKSIIFLGDSATLSTWIGTIICRIRGIKVSYWSHGFYGKEKGLKKTIRKLFFSLANSHLLYEKYGKSLMVSEGFSSEKLHVVFNSLDYDQSFALRTNADSLAKKEICPFFQNNDNPLLIFVGRLTRVKKLDQLISAISILNKKQKKINLIIIGEGPEKEVLTQLSESCSLTGNIHFYGACYSEIQLSKLISVADLCVSPGNVGLTAVHSLSYGTPVCTHGNFTNQMPEAGAIKNGETGVFFEENNIDSLANEIEGWIFDNPNNRQKIRQQCYRVIDLFYNPQYQLKVIENMLDDNLPFN